MFDRVARQDEPAPSTYESAGNIASVIAGCMLLIFVFPLMVLLAIWIRCDSRGPVFERRMGPDGRWLGLLKFRTTRFDEPARNRRTRAGAFLYYTRLEYLPNLIGVAHGEIGLAELWNQLRAQ